MPDFIRHLPNNAQQPTASPTEAVWDGRSSLGGSRRAAVASPALRALAAYGRHWRRVSIHSAQFTTPIMVPTYTVLPASQDMSTQA